MGYRGTPAGFVDFLKIVDIRTKIVSVSSLLVGSALGARHGAGALLLGPLRPHGRGDPPHRHGDDGLQQPLRLRHRRGHARVGPGAVQGAGAGATSTRGSRCTFRSRSIAAGRARWDSPSACAPAGAWSPRAPLHGLRVLLLRRAAPDLAHARWASSSREGCWAGRSSRSRPTSTRATWTPPRSSLGLPSSLVIAAILSTNNACDRVGDARAGRRTLAIVLGPGRGARPGLRPGGGRLRRRGAAPRAAGPAALGARADGHLGGPRLALALRP